MKDPNLTDFVKCLKDKVTRFNLRGTVPVYGRNSQIVNVVSLDNLSVEALTSHILNVTKSFPNVTLLIRKHG